MDTLFPIDPEPADSASGHKDQRPNQDSPGDGSSLTGAPLAERMRPRTFDEYVGQRHLLGPGRAQRVVQLDRAACLGERFEARPVGVPNDGGLCVQCPVQHVFALTDYLLQAGAQRIAVSQSDYIFRPGNPLLDALEARIGLA